MRDSTVWEFKNKFLLISKYWVPGPVLRASQQPHAIGANAMEECETSSDSPSQDTQCV